MKSLRTKILVTTTVVTLGISLGGITFWQNQSASAYPAGCVTQVCRDAYDRAENSERRSSEANATAITLESEVARLNGEIAALEAEIAENNRIAAELSEQITINQQKLELQQTALAKLLVNMHFDEEPDTIVLLASSSSLSDYTEKQSRQDTAKTQITTSAETVKNLKQELENQKAGVEALIASAEANKAAVAAKRNEQNELVAKYHDDAEAFSRDAAAARETMQQEIAAEIARYNSGGTVGEGVNSYPYSNICPDYTYQAIYNGDGAYGGYICQCTSYAGWKAYEAYGVVISSWGDARSWVGYGGVGRAARGRDGQLHAWRVDYTPAPYTIAVSTAGAFGHVMWVESVNANGTINLTEYNNTSSAASGREGDFGARYNVNPNAYVYIHFDQPIY